MTDCVLPGRIVHLLERFRSLSVLKRTGLVFCCALLLRLVFFHPFAMEVDTYHGFLMAADFWKRIAAGSLSFQGVHGLDHYPFLHPLLLGLLSQGEPGRMVLAARILAALCGAGTVVVGMRVARRLFDDDAVEHLTGLLLTISPPLVWMASNGRSFPLWTLCWALLALLLLDSLARPTPARAALMGVTACICYFARFEGVAAFLVVPVALLFAGKAEARRRLIAALAFAATFLVLATPYLLYLHAHFGQLTVAPRFSVLHQQLWAWYETGLPPQVLPSFPGPLDGFLAALRTNVIASVPFTMKALLDNMNLFVVLLLAAGLAFSGGRRVLLVPALMCLPACAFLLLGAYPQSFHYYSFVLLFVYPFAAHGFVSLLRRPPAMIRRVPRLRLIALCAGALFWGWQFAAFGNPELVGVWLPGLKGLLPPAGMAQSDLYALRILVPASLALLVAPIFLPAGARPFAAPAAALLVWLLLAILPVMRFCPSLAAFLERLLQSISGQLHLSALHLLLIPALVVSLWIFCVRGAREVGGFERSWPRFLLLCLAALATVQAENLVVRDFACGRSAFFNDHAPLAAPLEGLGKGTRVVSTRPTVAWLSGTHWVQFPLDGRFRGFSLRYVDYLVASDEMTLDRVTFDRERARKTGALVQVERLEEENPLYDPRPLSTCLYRVAPEKVEAVDKTFLIRE